MYSRKGFKKQKLAWDNKLKYYPCLHFHVSCFDSRLRRPLDPFCFLLFASLKKPPEQYSRLKKLLILDCSIYILLNHISLSINSGQNHNIFSNNSSLEGKTSLPHCACVTCMNEFFCEKVTHTDFACNIYWKLPLSPLFIAKLINK